MPNFSKFLAAEEGPKVVIYPREKAYKLYLWLLLLVAAFFVMYPLWHSGRPGILLWLTIIVLLVVAIANHFLLRFSYYILSQTKLWHVFYINANNIKIRGMVDRGLIIGLEKDQDHNIVVLSEKNKYYLKNIHKRDQVYLALQNELKLAAYQKDANLL